MPEKHFMVDTSEKVKNIEKYSETKTAATSKTPEIKKQNDSEKTISENSKSVNKSKVSDEKMNFKEYIGLLGLNKEKLISILKEKPNSIGEGGVEFKEAGVRVWFDKKK